MARTARTRRRLIRAAAGCGNLPPLKRIWPRHPYAVPSSSDLRPRFDPLTSLVGSILSIVVCGGIGGVAAWALVGTLEIGGTLGAVVAAIVGMVVAVALWAAGSAALRAMGLLR